MYILVTTKAGAPHVTLEEPDDCTRFHVAIQELSNEQATELLVSEGVGKAGTDQHAWITVSAIRERAQGGVAPDWPQRFDAMLAYAERKGWLSEDKAFIRGHIERSMDAGQLV
jgi:hypothetical protein